MSESYGKFAAGNAASPYITDDKTLYQPPVKTVTWYHTGAFLDRERILSQFEHEYFPRWFEARPSQTTDVLGGFQENAAAEPDFADAGPQRRRVARSAARLQGHDAAPGGLRARRRCAAGRRTSKPVKLFSTAYHNCHIDRLQPRGSNRHAVFLVTESEAITYHYELDLRADASEAGSARIAHTLNLRIDEFGNVLQSVAVVYPRFQSVR